MIYVYQILRQIRLDKKYNANAIATRLHLSEVRFHKLESTFTVLYNPLLTDWLDQLDISSSEHPWYIQKNEREFYYTVLRKNFPQLPEKFLERIADTLAFYKNIPNKQDLDANLMRHTISHILLRPRSADVAMDHIKDSDIS